MKKLMLLASLCLFLTGQTVSAQGAKSKDKDKEKEKSKDKAGVAVGGGGSTSYNRNDDDKEDSGDLRTFKSKLGNAKDRQVVITMGSSHVRVIGHNSDEVVIETRSYQAPPERAAGLKPLYNQAEDNTGLGLSAVKENNSLKISTASRGGGRYTIRVPKNASVVYRETNWQGSDFNLSDVDGEIELKLNNAGATLTNVSGPIVANTTNGSLHIKFSSLDQAKPSSISTINGSIDLTLPASTKADFKIKSIQGEIYTDFDMNLKKSGNSDLPRIAGGNTIEGKTNGGGVEVNVYTINSDIFIRKNK